MVLRRILYQLFVIGNGNNLEVHFPLPQSFVIPWHDCIALKTYTLLIWKHKKHLWCKAKKPKIWAIKRFNTLQPVLPLSQTLISFSGPLKGTLTASLEALPRLMLHFKPSHGLFWQFHGLSASTLTDSICTFMTSSRPLTTSTSSISPPLHTLTASTTSLQPLRALSYGLL